MQKNSLKFTILMIITFALWGGGMVAMKFTYDSFSITQIIFVRVAIASIFYLIFYNLWLPMPYIAGDWKYFILLVVFEPCLLFSFETASLQYTTASQGGIIAACFPICAAFLSWLILKEQITKKTVTGMILAVVGVAGASWTSVATESAPNPLLGNILMFGAVLSSSGYAICARHISQRYSFMCISAIQSVGGSIVLFPFIFTTSFPTEITMISTVALLYMGCCVGILAYMGFNYSLQHLPVAIVTLYASLIPVFTFIIAFFLLGEVMSFFQIFWIFIALLGIIWAALPEKKVSTNDSTKKGAV